jgi:hypothetical protein
MRRVILRMIAAGSLSAFSTVSASGLSGPAPGGVRAPAGSPVQPVRSPAAPPMPQQLILQQSGAGKAGGATPDRILPRGSLLDLSV